MIKIFASAPRTSLPPVSLPEDSSCFERIQAIWNAIYSYICEWACYLLSFVQSTSTRKDFVANSLSQCGPDPFFKITQYLEPEDVAHLEGVSPAIKAPMGERIWKSQCDLQKVSYTPESGKHKDAFAYPYPEMAFGPKEWVRFLGNPGEDLPRLPTNIHRFLANPKIKNKYVLTFCPATLNGAPFTLSHFRKQLATPREGLPVRFSDEHWPQIFRKFGEQPIGNARWLLMEKEVPTRTKGSTCRHTIGYRLGSALEVAVSVVGALYYPRTTYLLGPHPGVDGIAGNWIFTRTRDALEVHAGERNTYNSVVEEDESGCVVLGGQSKSWDQKQYFLSFLFARDYSQGRLVMHEDMGMAECFSVTREVLEAAF